VDDIARCTACHTVPENPPPPVDSILVANPSFARHVGPEEQYQCPQASRFLQNDFVKKNPRKCSKQTGIAMKPDCNSLPAKRFGTTPAPG
jgi:hypothetical protein